MKLISFKNYRGFRRLGSVPMDNNVGDNHLKRASWLTAQVESGGKFGAVMNYDGTGMTAGIHQAIAVYPKELKEEDGYANDDQGPLFKLLSNIRNATRENPYLELWGKIKDAGWILAQDGTLREADTGHRVFGKDIRYQFNGNTDGWIPEEGRLRDQAKNWFGSFCRLFEHPSTFEAQLQHGEEFFIKRAERTKLKYAVDSELKIMTIQDVVYGHVLGIPAITVDVLGPEIDLAMAMFWNYSVNAPGMALKLFCKVAKISTEMDRFRFAKELIRTLGTSSYGRWDDDIKGGRYQRTRDAAMKVWPRKLFENGSIMPKDLVG